jgi:hypothetical protein
VGKKQSTKGDHPVIGVEDVSVQEKKDKGSSEGRERKEDCG